MSTEPSPVNHKQDPALSLSQSGDMAGKIPKEEMEDLREAFGKVGEFDQHCV